MSRPEHRTVCLTGPNSDSLAPECIPTPWFGTISQQVLVATVGLNPVFSEVQDRLTNALSARITPRAVYNKIAPPDLTAKAPDESWTQPLSLLLGSARLMRESLTDPYFPRRLSGLCCKETEFQAVMDIFGDAILKDADPRRARSELDELAQIEASDAKPKEKCAAVWTIIAGETKS